MNGEFSRPGEAPEPKAAEICLPAHLRKPRLRRDEAAEYLLIAHGIQRSPATLATDAVRGGGPPYQRFNRSPLYARVDLDEWATTKLGRPCRSTSEEEKEHES